MILQEEYPDYFSAAKNDLFQTLEPLIICFEKIQSNDYEYQVSFRSAVDEDTLFRDTQAELIENNEVRPEGSIKYYYGKRYERDAINRKKALKIHGFRSIICKFDFEKVYGVRGKDFIEIHHTKPLYTLEGKLTDINPETDLVPVCSNCHRMIHRRHDNVLSIEELIAIVGQMRS